MTGEETIPDDTST